MDKIIGAVKSLTDSVRSILTGEPARAIGYGGAAIIYIVAKASGHIPDQTPEEALTEAGAAIAVVASFVETIRKFVYSPNSVNVILDSVTGLGHAANGAVAADAGDTV